MKQQVNLTENIAEVLRISFGIILGIESQMIHMNKLFMRASVQTQKRCMSIGNVEELKELR